MKKIADVVLSSSSAWANDTAYENIFVEQLKNLFSAGDVVIAISASGNSRNVVKAVEYANTKKSDDYRDNRI